MITLQQDDARQYFSIGIAKLERPGQQANKYSSIWQLNMRVQQGF
jgi:hypothetical protein